MPRNYIGFIRRALEKAGMEQIPVISINLSGLENNPGFKLTLPAGDARSCTLLYSAIFSCAVVYRMRPYEAVPGSADAHASRNGKKSVKTFVPKDIHP